MTSHYTRSSMTTLHGFGGVLGRPLDTFLGLSQFHGHGSWLVCEEAAPRLTIIIWCMTCRFGITKDKLMIFDEA